MMNLVADTCFTLGKKQQEILDVLEYHLKKKDEIIERERNKKDELVRKNTNKPKKKTPSSSTRDGKRMR